MRINEDLKVRRKKYNTNVRNHYCEKRVSFQPSRRKPIKLPFDNS